jgi:hypothetical protein
MQAVKEAGPGMYILGTTSASPIREEKREKIKDKWK